MLVQMMVVASSVTVVVVGVVAAAVVDAVVAVSEIVVAVVEGIVVALAIAGFAVFAVVESSGSIHEHQRPDHMDILVKSYPVEVEVHKLIEKEMMELYSPVEQTWVQVQLREACP